jgi:hypothetical protein
LYKGRKEHKMNRFFGLFVAVVLIFSVGCAGMSQQDLNNRTANAGIWSAIGAGAGVAVGALTGGKNAMGIGAIAGGLLGGALGAMNTPSSQYQQQQSQVVQQSTSGNPGVEFAYASGVARRKAIEQQLLQQKAYREGLGDAYYYTNGSNRGRISLDLWDRP